MKRTRQVKLTLLASLAAFLTGCGPDPRSIRRCVDTSNHVVDDWYCTDDYQRQHSTPGVYRFYYGGPSAYVPVGSVVSGGSYAAPPGVTSFTSPTSRGVIGGAGEAHGAVAHGAAAGE